MPMAVTRFLSKIEERAVVWLFTKRIKEERIAIAIELANWQLKGGGLLKITLFGFRQSIWES